MNLEAGLVSQSPLFWDKTQLVEVCRAKFI